MRPPHRISSALAAVALASLSLVSPARTQGVEALGPPEPTVVDPNLAVRTIVKGLVTPTTMAFIGEHDILVLEKNTGKVQRIVDGVIRGPVLSLPVNTFSERGLLGIALHPDFPDNPGVYLYWSESSTGTVTADPLAVPLLGNRVDRFVWNGSALTLEKNLIKLRAFQFDSTNGIPRGNHDGGVLAFEPTGRGKESRERHNHADKGDERAKLLILIGDVGRRGQLQNLPDGPFGPGIPDDQFGGPQPDNAHLTGVILRLNDDGSTPNDNPFFKVGASMGGEVGANIQKIFAYGVRNSFGIAFDPQSGHLWTEENGDDAFDEINRVEAGFNGGWIQIMGPEGRIKDYKFIETGCGGACPQYRGLQQVRWDPARIADSPEQARQRLFVLPGSRYTDPEFAWKFAVPPAAIGFLDGDELGDEYEGNLFVGAATTRTEGGHLFRFKLTKDRLHLDVPSKVAENEDKHKLTGSEHLLFGRNFGIGTAIVTGPNGNLFVVSLTKGAIYEIYRR
jgi:glucose/arabinose dehydrogenase